MLATGVILGLHPALGQSNPSPELPAPQAHPLPPILAQWQDVDRQGDYFDQVKPTSVGALVWSRLPVLVYVEPPQQMNDLRAAEWTAVVTRSVQEWVPYFPLQFVNDREQADITILRSTLPLRLKPSDPDQKPEKQVVERARSAEARYELYIRRVAQEPPTLVHRFYITLSPRQGLAAIRAAARHEMGHALGIWGHSLNQSDVLYFAQVRHPPTISARDVNTLKRIYQMPTSLGWPMPPTSNPVEMLSP